MYFFSDTGTCGSTNGGCEQVCVDTDGGYYCKCDPGYETHPYDPKKCVGKLTPSCHFPDSIEITIGSSVCCLGDGMGF